MKQRNNGRAMHSRLGRFVRDGKSKTRTDKMREMVRKKIGGENIYLLSVQSRSSNNHPREIIIGKITGTGL